MEIELRSKVNVTVEVLAEVFCALDDDQMCKFLVEVARLAQNFQGSPDNQWYYLGGHLKNCECSTPEAREMIKRWAHYAEVSEHN